MQFPTACFFTVCGGGEDYEFLLGSIEHHARMGTQVVLDTTPPERARRFRKLPTTVIWLHAPAYGSGWKEFRYRAALKDAMDAACSTGAEVIVHLDSDEFFSTGTPEALFPLARGAMIEVETYHWMPDGTVRSFGDSEFHRRLWPSHMSPTWPINSAWVQSPNYNGNPDHHAVPLPPQGSSVVRVDGPFHHHVHYAVGLKSQNDETARTTINGWPDGRLIPSTPWPDRLRRWKESGVKPSESFA